MFIYSIDLIPIHINNINTCIAWHECLWYLRSELGDLLVKVVLNATFPLKSYFRNIGVDADILMVARCFGIAPAKWRFERLLAFKEPGLR